VPGLRIGFLATANVAWMAQLRAMQPPWPLSGIAEAWARANLNCSNLGAVRESLRPLASERKRLSDALSALPGLTVLPSDANFLMVKTGDTDAVQLADALGRKGILIRVCNGFQGVSGAGYFRVAVRTTGENERLLAALEAVLRRDLHKSKPPRRRLMRSISVLGTSSNSGKSWVATALCAWLRRRGVRVAPFKAQNMSNNSAVAFDGGEIGRAQAVQAEACGLAPSVRMNPILLKPSGSSGSQLVVLGEARGHLKAHDYYQSIESLWPVVAESLKYWDSRCDALILEGAGSPVELNLMRRDLVNLRPAAHLDGRWVLVADIEKGGVFAQAAGTWSLVPPPDRLRCSGLIVNKFRGDLSLFADAGSHFAPHFGAPFLGTLPYARELQPENEDSLCEDPATGKAGEPIHWIRFPHASVQLPRMAVLRIRDVRKPDPMNRLPRFSCRGIFAKAVLVLGLKLS
ncbi:MAG: cobyric acid synthase, partial [Verrucomicrobia bacterium]|nr:cobyric acid synthase [Verrucomicrobiota bacterium]